MTEAITKPEKYKSCSPRDITLSLIIFEINKEIKDRIETGQELDIIRYFYHTDIDYYKEIEIEFQKKNWQTKIVNTANENSLRIY